MRLLTLCFGVVSFAWSIITFPTRWRQWSSGTFGIIDRNAYESKALALMMPQAEACERGPYCGPEALRSTPLLKSRLLEDAMGAGEREVIDIGLVALDESALNEFARMLRSGFYEETIAKFIGPGWSIRDRLLSHLVDVPKRNREVFAKGLDQRGYDVAVPGIAHQDPRPWN
jgi:hypothetical protein